jgi:hypothetical protein
VLAVDERFDDLGTERTLWHRLVGPAPPAPERASGL